MTLKIKGNFLEKKEKVELKKIMKKKTLILKERKNFLKRNIQNHLWIISEKVKEDMTNQYDQVYQFLNLPSFHANYQLEHVSNNQKIPNKRYKKLLDYYATFIDILCM